MPWGISCGLVTHRVDTTWFVVARAQRPGRWLDEQCARTGGLAHSAGLLGQSPALVACLVLLLRLYPYISIQP